MENNINVMKKSKVAWLLQYTKTRIGEWKTKKYLEEMHVSQGGDGSIDRALSVLLKKGHLEHENGKYRHRGEQIKWKPQN